MSRCFISLKDSMSIKMSLSEISKVFLIFFVKNFYGPDRITRLRPFHFQFTEPSFEVDINCGICLGTGTLKNGDACRLCKSGWLELGGSGMVHPNVLKAGGVDPNVYSGFAFGWGDRTHLHDEIRHSTRRRPIAL